MALDVKLPGDSFKLLTEWYVATYMPLLTYPSNTTSE